MAWTWSGATRTMSPGVWVNDLLDWVVPGKIEKYLPLPRYHPWLFGIGMMGWGMARQSAIMKGSSTNFFGVDFPIAPDTINANGGIFGKGNARGALMLIGTFIFASTVAQLAKEAN